MSFLAYLTCPFQPFAFANAKTSTYGAKIAVCLLAFLACILAAPAGAWAVSADDLAFMMQNGKFANLIFGLFIGILLTASAYLFFIWIMMRDRGQIFLLFMLLSLLLYIVSTNDLLMEYSALDNMNARNLLANYSLIMAILFSAVFTYYFLEIDIYTPSLLYALAVPGAVLGVLLVVLSFNQSFAQLFLPFFSLLTVAAILIAGLAGIRQGTSGSLTHIIAFLFFLGGTLAGSLYDAGYIHEADTSSNLTYLSFAMSALMFAFVIASQFAARQEEKERALAVSNERFVLATRGANEGLFDWDLTSGEVFFSEQFRKILGKRLDNATDGLKQWARLVVNPDKRIVREALRRFRRNKEISTINIEYRIQYPTGEKRWLHTKVVAVRNAGAKKIQRLVGSTHDITVRKQSEIALRASEARFRSITEAHPVPVMIVSLNNNGILYASPGAEQLLMLNQEQLLRSSFDYFLTDERARQEIWQAMRGGSEVNLKEVTLDYNQGQKLNTALSARRISYQGEEAMVIGIYDLTERKQAEAQILRQQEALQQSEKMAALGGLLAGVAHELNNPLSVVVGQATLLMDSGAEPKIVTRAEKIYKAADRCSRIVKSFLALARRKPPERKPVDINGLVQSALELLGYQIRTGNIEVTLDLMPGLPEVTGDGDQLIQVVTNLVLNAAQAMDAWQGTRRIKIQTRTEDNKTVLSVSDSGPGVPPEIRTRIFEPFFTTKGSKGGTGVGLSLCLNIVASHGGQLLIEDTPGGGATFVVQIPVATTAGTETAQEQRQSDLPKMKILIVDDEIELAQTLADLLEPEGHEIDVAINGAVALEKLHKKPFDLIVSDLRMPVLDGPGLYDALKRELPTYVNKIIYVTGDTLSSHVQSFLNQYPVPVIDKPYRLSDVRKAIAELLKNAAGEKSA